jgi:hypothetical protein
VTPAEEFLQRGLHDAASRVPVEPPPWPPEHAVRVEATVRSRPQSRLPVILAAACLLVIAAVGFWYVRPRPHATPAIDSPSIPVGTVTNPSVVTNSSVAVEPAPSAASPTTTTVVAPVSTQSENPQRQHRVGSVSIKELIDGLPILGAATDNEVLAPIGATTLTASVSGGRICVSMPDGLSGGDLRTCSTTSVSALAGRFAPLDAVAVQVLVLARDISVTSVDGSCSFILAGTDEANGFNVWACETPSKATVELDLQVSAGPTLMAYIDGGVE